MTDKQWIEISEKVIPHLEAINKVVNEHKVSLYTGLCANKKDLYIFHVDGDEHYRIEANDCVASIELNDKVIRKIKKVPISEQEDRDKEKYTIKL